jgi:hypothetical protein
MIWTQILHVFLLDGNLGLGLYIGPYCMQMAIDKAKKHGVGFVACKNSTVSRFNYLLLLLLHILCFLCFFIVLQHYGIAGYYATMATDQGWYVFFVPPLYQSFQATHYTPCLILSLSALGLQEQTRDHPLLLLLELSP